MFSLINKVVRKYTRYENCRCDANFSKLQKYYSALCKRHTQRQRQTTLIHISLTTVIIVCLPCKHCSRWWLHQNTCTSHLASPRLQRVLSRLISWWSQQCQKNILSLLETLQGPLVSLISTSLRQCYFQKMKYRQVILQHDLFVLCINAKLLKCLQGIDFISSLHSVHSTVQFWSVIYIL